VAGSPDGVYASPVAAAAVSHAPEVMEVARSHIPAAKEFEFGEHAFDEAVEAMDAAIGLTRHPKSCESPARKRRKAADGGAAPNATGWDYSTLSAEVRQYFELMRDSNGQLTLVTARRGCRLGRLTLTGFGCCKSLRWSAAAAECRWRTKTGFMM